MKKNVFLFGAGAMIDFGGPKTDELTDKFIDVLKESDWKWLVSSLDKSYGENKYNFETILASIESLLDWSIASNSQGYVSVNNTSINSFLFKPNHHIPSTEIIWNNYKKLINFIIDRISVYDNFNPKDNSHNILCEYFEKKIKNARIKVFSLNYDRLLPQIIRRKCADGTETTNRDYAFFNYDIKGIFQSKWAYINLHGSIYLRQVPDNFYKVAQFKEPQHLENAHFCNGGSPNENKLFTPIIAGYSKSQRMLSEPFSFYIGALMADCNLCDELYIVGYSFSDPHINSILKNYIHLNKTKVIIIDKKEDIDDIVNIILYKFNIICTFESTEYGYRNKEGNILIYNKGFLKYMIDSSKNMSDFL